MKKVVNLLLWIGALLFLALIAFSILSNIVENLRLATGGVVAQGIIDATGNCGSKHKPMAPMVVQFTDTQGRKLYADVENGCGYVGIPFRNEGDHVSVVYLPSTPTLARIQSDLVLQFWLIEAPLLLIILLVAFFWLRRFLRRSLKS